MENREENHRDKDEGDGAGEDEDDGEEEVVGRILHEEQSQELSVELYLWQPLVQPQSRSSTIGHQSLQVELGDGRRWGSLPCSSCCRGRP